MVRSTGPDATGFLIIGAADENALHRVFFVTKDFTLNLVSGDGKTVSVRRQGCNTYQGLMSGQSCASDRQIAWQVVELPPGDWRVDSISDFIVRGFPARGDVASAKLPAGIVIHVGPGAIVYAGDFLFHLDPTPRPARSRHAAATTKAPRGRWRPTRT